MSSMFMLPLANKPVFIDRNLKMKLRLSDLNRVMLSGKILDVSPTIIWGFFRRKKRGRESTVTQRVNHARGETQSTISGSLAEVFISVGDAAE